MMCVFFLGIKPLCAAIAMHYQPKSFSCCIMKMNGVYVNALACTPVVT